MTLFKEQNGPYRNTLSVKLLDKTARPVVFNLIMLTQNAQT